MDLSFELTGGLKRWPRFVATREFPRNSLGHFGAGPKRRRSESGEGRAVTDGLQKLAEGLGFPEGPVVCPDGSLIVTEIKEGRLTRIAPDGAKTLFSACGGGPNGLAFGPDGALYLCNNGGNRYADGFSMGVGPHPNYAGGYIQRVDAKTGEAKVLYAEVDGHRLSAPNDIVFDAQGGFYFTDVGKRFSRNRDHGGLYYALPDGSRIEEIAYPMFTPNGCALSPDGRTLYVAETEGARLVSFEVEGPGVLKKAPPFAAHSGRVVAGLPGGAKFDSIKALANGNIVCATLITGYLTEFAPDGRVVAEIKMPDVFPTNLCFGGPDMRTAYITLSDHGQVGVMRWASPGLTLNFCGRSSVQ